MKRISPSGFCASGLALLVVLAVGSKGNLYCGDIVGRRIQKFDLKK